MRSLPVLLSLVAISIAFSGGRVKRQLGQADFAAFDKHYDSSASVDKSEEERVTEVISIEDSSEEEGSGHESEEGSGSNSSEESTDFPPILLPMSSEESEESDRFKRANDEPRVLF